MRGPSLHSCLRQRSTCDRELCTRIALLASSVTSDSRLQLMEQQRRSLPPLQLASTSLGVGARQGLLQLPGCGLQCSSSEAAQRRQPPTCSAGGGGSSSGKRSSRSRSSRQGSGSSGNGGARFNFSSRAMRFGIGAGGGAAAFVSGQRAPLERFPPPAAAGGCLAHC